MGAALAADEPIEPAEGCRDGDSVGFDEAYRRFGRSLYGTALRMLRGSADAEDAMQDTFLALYHKQPDLPPAALGPWLRRVLVNRCLDRLRRGQRWRESEVGVEHEPTAPADEYRGLDLDRAVARLPERARVVFLLHDVEGFKHREMAEQLGLSDSTTKTQLFRARRLLRKLMQPGGRR